MSHHTTSIMYKIANSIANYIKELSKWIYVIYLLPDRISFNIE